MNDSCSGSHSTQKLTNQKLDISLPINYCSTEDIKPKTTSRYHLFLQPRAQKHVTQITTVSYSVRDYPGGPVPEETFTHSYPWEKRRRIHTDNKVHCWYDTLQYHNVRTEFLKKLTVTSITTTIIIIITINWLDLAALVDNFSHPSANFFFLVDLSSSLIWTCTKWVNVHIHICTHWQSWLAGLWTSQARCYASTGTGYGTVTVSVCHKSVICRWAWRLLSTYPRVLDWILALYKFYYYYFCYEEIRVATKIMVLPWNFAMTSIVKTCYSLYVYYVTVHIASDKVKIARERWWCSERDKLDRRQSTKLAIPPSSDAQQL